MKIKQKCLKSLSQMAFMVHERNTLPNILKTYKVHLIAWTLFLSYEIIMVGLINKRFDSFLYYFAFYLLNISLFYFFAHQMLPLVLQTKRPSYVFLPILLVCTFACYYVITVLLDSVLTYYANAHTFKLVPSSFDSLLRSLYRFLLFVGFSTGYYFLITFLKEHKRVEETEREKLLAELQNQKIKSELVESQMAYLKAQINPHFLFNTLNFLYINARKNAPEIAQAVISLSEIMRFSIECGSRPEPPDVLSEIEQVRNLIYLHDLRVNQSTRINLIYNEHELEGVKVIPLLIITLIENIFKHANFDLPSQFASLEIRYLGGKLQIVTVNHRHKQIVPGNKIGLTNIRNRLFLNYGNLAELTIDETDPAIFKTAISIG